MSLKEIEHNNDNNIPLNYPGDDDKKTGRDLQIEILFYSLKSCFIFFF